jgi:HEAT repeat protein
MLGSISETVDCVEIYRNCLKDKSPRVRGLALKKISELASGDLNSLKADIQEMLSDPDMKVKQIAVKVLKKL